MVVAVSGQWPGCILLGPSVRRGEQSAVVVLCCAVLRGKFEFEMVRG